jgi:UDP-N-acetylmuramyl pentapeptide phosphotransferase/UDP-N-acetylglucosamine-1-phosphate transferase
MDMTGFMDITYLVGGLVTCLVCLMLVLTKSWHGVLTLDGSTGVQKFHTAPTPRVGGVGIIIGAFVAWRMADDPLRELLGQLFLAGMPAFLFGIAEDLTKRVGVKERLLATMASGVLGWWITGISITHVGLWGVDWLLAWLPFSLAFTAFAVGGVANAVNIIDGFNGLASGAIALSLASMAGMAWLSGDAALAQVCVVLASVALGFWLVNFPLGKIFLGDGGAYVLGFWLAWLAVLLPQRNADISPWAGLLACGYPILEVLFSIWRRTKRNLHPGHPDRLHLHSLVKSRIVNKRFPHWPGVIKNAAVSPLIWCFAAGPALLALVFRNNQWALMGSFVACAVAYSLVYARLVRFRWGGR